MDNSIFLLYITLINRMNYSDDEIWNIFMSVNTRITLDKKPVKIHGIFKGYHYKSCK